MPTIEIEVKNKIAKSPTERIVCGNSDFKIVFAFDEEWAEHNVKTARFVHNGKYDDVVFSGNICSVPIINNTTICKVGVFAGDLRTTTPAYIGCYQSILCEDGVPADPQPDVYQQLIERINDGSLKGPKGEKGDTGATGPQGPQGVQGEKGDKGEKGDNGGPGKDGADGYTPVKGVDYFDGKDGKDGAAGADGRTPEKGVDYFTAADKQEIITAVLDAMPAAEEVLF